MSDFRRELYQHYVTTFTVDSAFDENYAPTYWTWCEYKYLPIFEKLSREAVILEAGCGPGYFMDFLKRHGFSNVEGIDGSPEQVGVAKKRGLNVQVADVLDFLDQKEKAFDVIIAIDLIEHFTRDELLRLFSIFRQALKNNGLLIVQTPNGQGLFPGQVIYGDLTHLTIFTPGSLQQLLRLFGFSNIQFRETGPVPKNLMGKIRVALWSLVKALGNTVRKIEKGEAQEIWTENVICYCNKTSR